MTTLMVLPFGTTLRIIHVDRNGLCGRDLHPKDSDIGFTGVVYKNHVESNGECQENVPPGTSIEYEEDDESGAFPFVIYTIIDSEGRSLEVATWEVCAPYFPEIRAEYGLCRFESPKVDTDEVSSPRAAEYLSEVNAVGIKYGLTLDAGHETIFVQDRDEKSDFYFLGTVVDDSGSPEDRKARREQMLANVRRRADLRIAAEKSA